MLTTRSFVFMPLFCLAMGFCPSMAECDEPNLQTYSLKYQFHSGEIIRYQISDLSRIKVTQGEVVQTNFNLTKSIRSIHVKDVQPGGTATVELQIDRTIMETKFDDESPVKFDSNSKQSPPPQFDTVLKSVGIPLNRALVNGRGELLSMVSLTEKQQDPGDIANPTVNFLIVFPEEPISIGHIWKEDYEINVAVDKTKSRKIRMQRVFELKSVTDGIALITLKTGPLTPVNDPEMEARMAQQTPNGEIHFELASGRIVQRDYQVDKIVVGGFGPNTSFKVANVRKDTLLSTDQTVSSTTNSKH